MGRLEKQIIVGAIALVAVLLGIVVLTGVKPAEAGGEGGKRPDWSNPGLLFSDPQADTTPSGPEPGLGGASLSLDDPVVSLDGETQPSEGGEASLEESSQQPPKALATPPAPSIEADAGKVLSLEDDLDRLARYEVKKGETLGEIAMRELGSMHDVDLILEVNEGMRANRVVAGDVIWLPSRQLADQRRATRASTNSTAKSEAPAKAAAAGRRSHEVVSGDSLWRIAEQYYGREGANQGVRRIVAANSKLSDANTVLRLGWVLVIPE